MQAQGRRNGAASSEQDGGNANDFPPPLAGATATNSNGNRSTSTPRGNTRAQQLTTATTATTTTKRGNTQQASSNGESPFPSRSSSRSKQRAAGGTETATATTATLTAYEQSLAKMKKASAGKGDHQLELLLQQLLQKREFEDAAYLIASSPFLESKYKASDVIRLLLDIKQFDKAAQLIRDMKLQSNQLLVTLFIKELVRCSLFQSAVRYAQEMVQNFGKNDFTDQTSRPSWTPQAMIQAMIRAQAYRSALKYAKQFGLLEMFPPVELISRMFEVRSWEDGVSSVLEYRLFQDFPLELLVQKLLEHRQWNNAVKCINKLPSKALIDSYNQVLVREAARMGDFVIAIRYLREFKLDQQDDTTNNTPLLKYIVDCMVRYSELYKAIKYSIKFGLHVADADAEETGETSVYDTQVLIRKAMECGQFHVAVMYIKKLKLKDQFAKELELIQQKQAAMVRDFHQFVAARDSQFHHPHVQREMAAILGRQLETDNVEERLVETEVVLSMEEVVVPRTKPRKEQEQQVAVMASQEQGVEGLVGHTTTEDPPFEAPRRSSRFSFARFGTEGTTTSNSAPTVAAPSQVVSQQQQQPVAVAPRAMGPPGLASQATEFMSSSQNMSSSAASAFDFAHFAATIQSATGGNNSSSGMAMPSGPSPSALTQQHQHPHQHQHQQQQLSMSQPPQQQQQQLGSMAHLFPQHTASPMAPPGGSRSGHFYQPPPPPPGPHQFNGSNGMLPPGGQHGYPGSHAPPPPPSSHQQQQQQGPPPPMFYQQPPPGQAGFPHGLPPPPPNGSMMNQGFDISSLAMQFHARPPAPAGLGLGGGPGGGGGGNGAGSLYGSNAFGPPPPLGGPGPVFSQNGGPPPPPLPPGMPSGLFPSLGPPMQMHQMPMHMQMPMQMQPPQMTQSSFRPSMSYTTSVTRKP